MNQKAFSLIEIIVSIAIFIIFSTGYVFFLTQENLTQEVEQNLSLSTGLINEAQEIIKNKGAGYFTSGNWSMYTLSGSTTFFSGTSLGSGLYINSLGKNSPQISTNTFKRLIIISTGSTTYIGSTAKNISIPFLTVYVQIWYPGCNFSGNVCAYRNFIVY